jgi:hypothetical protein
VNIVLKLIWQRHALCYVTYLAMPRPMLCHLSGNATPSVMSLIWQRHAFCYVTYLATPCPLLCHLSGNATPSVMSLIWQRHALCYVTPDKSLLILCKNKMRHSYCTRHSCMSQNNCAVDHSPRIRGDFTIQKRNIVFIFIYRGTIPFRK